MTGTRPRTPRIAHLGLGAFARSHQAWYTEMADDGWGIVAIPNRSTAVLDRLAEQGFSYGLLVRGPETDTCYEMDSVLEASADALADPGIALMTMTVSEAGYLPGAHPIGVLIDGLRARRDAGAGAIAFVPCDNVPANGRVLRDILLATAEPDLASWIEDNVSFVSTMVDRITPAATDADRQIASDILRWEDGATVVTEPFSEWVLQGDFPAGRPAWEKAGAQFVDDVEPYEQRKLWMLNGAHTLLAYRGLELGFETVFEAWGALAAEVEQLWAEAREVLTLDATNVDPWLAELRVRWQNPRMEHRLEQVAQGGEQKIPARIGAVIQRREEAGLPAGTAELETIAAWERFKESNR